MKKGEERRNFSSSSIFHPFQVYYLVCTVVVRYRMSCFFRHEFLWKQGAHVGKETPRGWGKLFCNFSGLLVSRAVLVLLIETKFSPPWLIGRIRFFPFQIAQICRLFFSFLLFLFFDKYRIDFQDISGLCTREFSKGRDFLDIFTLKIYIPGVLTVEIYVEVRIARIFIKSLTVSHDCIGIVFNIALG